MKRVFVFLLALSAVFLLKWGSLAEAKVKAAATRTFTGTVLWVDPVYNSIVLKGGEDEVRFKVVSSAKLKRRGKAVMLAKFVRGDKVTIVYKVERKTKIATAITL